MKNNNYDRPRDSSFTDIEDTEQAKSSPQSSQHILQVNERVRGPEDLASSNVRGFLSKIRSVRDRIANYLRPRPSEKELTSITDEALVDTAERSVDAGVSGEMGSADVVDAVQTVLVEGAMESSSQQSADKIQNPIQTLIQDGYKDAVDIATGAFGSDTLPNGNLVAEVVSNVARESSDGSVGATEQLALPESINERIGLALEASSFKQSPEIKAAIEGYYQDHYRLGSLVERVIEGSVYNVDRQDIAEQFGNCYLRGVADNLLSKTSRIEVLRASEEILSSVLFNEVAVGQETISEPEDQYVIALSDKLRQKAVDEDLGYSYIAKGGDEPTYRWHRDLLNPSDYDIIDKLTPERLAPIRSKSRMFLWDDTRHAGQLEFHNTGQFDKLSLSGFNLRSRTRQKELTGTFHAQMPTHQRSGGNMHSNLPHFSETYDDSCYKSQVTGKDVIKGTEQLMPATAAIPLAEIIAVAPYARNAKFGIVELKDVATLDQVPINDKTGFIGSQGEDGLGRQGEDRVFMADYRLDHASAAVNYDLPFGDNGYVIMTEQESYGSNGRPGYNFGNGKGYPSEIIVPAPYDVKHPNEAGGSPNESMEEYRRRLDEINTAQASAIRELQAKSRQDPRYSGRVVIEFESEAAPLVGFSAQSYRYQQTARHSPAPG